MSKDDLEDILNEDDDDEEDQEVVVAPQEIDQILNEIHSNQSSVEQIDNQDDEQKLLDDILNEEEDSPPQQAHMLEVKDKHNQAQQLLQQNRRSILPPLSLNPQQSIDLLKQYIDFDFPQEEEQKYSPKISDIKQPKIQRQLSLLDQIEQEELQVNQQLYQPLILDILRKEQRQIQNLEIHLLKTLQNNIQNNQSIRLRPYIGGSPCVIIQCPGINICIGTTAGDIAVFSYKNFDMYVVMRNKAAVTCIDQTASGFQLIAGYENGQIILWESNSGSQLKVIETKQILIRAIKFLNDQDQLNKQIVYSDQQSCTYQMNIIKGFWGYTAEGEKFIQRNDNPYYQILIQNGYAALASLDSVVLVKLIDKSIVIKIPKSNYDDFRYPYISFGLMTNTEGYTETIDQCLSISWGSTLDLYVLTDTLKFKCSINTPKLLNCAWISRDMLAAIDKDYNVLTFNAQFMMKNSIYEPLQSTLPLGDRLEMPTEVTTLRGNKLLLNINNVSYSNVTNQIYVLTKPIIKRINLLMWSDYLKILISKADSQESWYQILIFGLQLYWNQIHCFAQHGYDQKIIIGEISADICSTYMSLVGQRIDSLQIPLSEKFIKWDNAIVAAIQYCIECNQQQYLFTKLRLQLIKFSKYNEFLNSLEPFILRQQIKQVPNDVLLQIATHYKVMDKKQVVKQLILNLDIKTIDLGIIFQICMQLNIYTPLIFVCPRIDNDFITPLQKMFQKYLTEKLDNMLLKCLWFIKMTFNRILFPNQEIEFNIWTQAIKQVLMWLLVDDILIEFTKLYPKETFEVLQICFNDPCSVILCEQDETNLLIRYFNNEKDILYEILKKIYKSITQESIYIFAQFLGQLNFKDVHVDGDVMIQMMKVLVSSIDNFELIVNILNHVHLIQSDVEELINLSKDSLVKALFIGQYNLLKAFSLLFDEPQQLDNKRLFKFIEIHIKDKEILQALIIYFDVLLKQDIKQFAQILKLLFNKDLLQLLQREVCDGYLELLGELDSQNHEIRQLYIKQLCLADPEDVINKVNNLPLDELETIFVETNHKEGLGYYYAKVGKLDLAYQFYTQALLEYLEIGMSQVLNNIQYQKHLLDRKFTQVFDVCFDLKSYDNKDLFYSLAKSLFNKQQYESLWIYTYSINERNFQQVIQFIQHINKYLSQLYEQLDVNQLINIMESQPQIFDLVWIKDSFKQLFKNMKSNINLELKTKTIVLNNFNDQKQQLFHLYSSSQQYLSLRCTVCDKMVDQKQMELKLGVIIRACGHITHTICSSQRLCELCNPLIKIQIESVIFKEKNQEQIIQPRMTEIEELQLSNEDIQRYRDFKIMKKLEKFDYIFDQL